MNFKIRKLLEKLHLRRPTGCLRNKRDLRDRIFSSSRTTLPRAVSLEDAVQVVSQSSTSSCVANALCGAIRIMENRSGHAYLYPSRLWVYWHSRIRHDKMPLKDAGTYIREACKAITRHGVPDEKDWPFKTNKVNKQPSGYAPTMGADPRKSGEYVSIQSGTSVVSEIKKALADGYPVVFGTVVTDTFMKSNGSSYIAKPSSGEKHRGRHALCIVGYEQGSDGKTWFRVLNSWGKKWRDGGMCWMHEDYIKWSASGDFTIIRGWKRLIER